MKAVHFVGQAWFPDVSAGHVNLDTQGPWSDSSWQTRVLCNERGVFCFCLKPARGLGSKVIGLQSHSWTMSSQAWCHVIDHQICEGAVSSFLLLA